jgi:hypothetical protein
MPQRTSLIIMTAAAPAGTSVPSFTASGAAVGIEGPWTVRFLAGGPSLPRERTIHSLRSWTAWDDDEATAFSGTAAYTTRFPAPSAKAPAWQLDLRHVHESAEVRVNGRQLGTLLGPSFQVMLDGSWLAASNELEVSVSNLMANRIASLDRAGILWRKFYNINFPSRFPENRGADGLFSAAGWQPLESGLVGPVTLTPLRR